MNYFIENDVTAINFGGVKSVLNRQKAFKAAGEKSKILTMNKNLQLSRFMEMNKLSSDDYLNMYDYFQRIPSGLPRKKLGLRHANAIPKNEYMIEGVDPNSSLLKKEGQLKGVIKVAPGSVQILEAIQYFDKFGNNLMTDYYDWRGFLSHTTYYLPDGRESSTQYYDLDKKVRISVQSMNDANGNYLPTTYTVYDIDGLNEHNNKTFSDEESMFVYFVNELQQKEPGSIIVDNYSMIRAGARIRVDLNDSNRIYYLHVSHLNGTGDSKLHYEMNPGFNEFISNYVQYYHMILVGDENQANELREMIGASSNNVRYLKDNYFEEKSIEKSHKYHEEVKNLSFFGRLYDDKRIKMLIEAISIVTKKYPDIKFNLYGLGEQKFQDELHEQVAELELEKNVFFNDYLYGNRLEDAYDNTDLVITYSYGEGGGIAISEAFMHGIPVVSGVSNYGNLSLVEHNKTGKLVKKGGNSQDIANTILDYLKNPGLVKEHGLNARNKAIELFSIEAIKKNLLEVQLDKKEIEG